MKATVTKITPNALQIDVEVSYTDNSGGKIADRVFTLPYDKYSSLDEQGLRDFIINEGKIHQTAIAKEDDFKKLIGIEILIDDGDLVISAPIDELEVGK